MATASEDVGTDWERSAGDFSCSVCRRKRLPASEFSGKQVERALAALRDLEQQSKDIRVDGSEKVETALYLAAVCKRCTQEKEAQEREQAAARRAEKEGAENDGPDEALQPGERVTLQLPERPFGMVPSKLECNARSYTVTKATEGKPACKAGVKAGWKVVAVAGASCLDLDLEGIQILLKDAALPVDVEFETVPANGDYCTACQQVLTTASFSRKMRTKPPDKRRCTACVDAEGGGGTAEPSGEPEEREVSSTSKLGELRALCAEAAQQGEKVTGLKAVRGGSAVGRGRGRGQR